MKKRILVRKSAWMIGAAMIFSMAACGGANRNGTGGTTAGTAAGTAEAATETAGESAAAEESSEGSMEMPNPFSEYSSLEEAEKDAGFEISVPDSIGDSDHCVYRVLDSENPMIEIIYFDGENETARIRKAAGDDDISGDYGSYSSQAAWDGPERSGNYFGSDGKYTLATWTSIDGWTYSLSVEEPVSADEMDSLVQAVE
ncbi:MAG: hypothetical protein ACOX8B_00975 [Lachnospiraceae bacterium]|jgi:hypothetical protein